MAASATSPHLLRNRPPPIPKAASLLRLVAQLLERGDEDAIATACDFLQLRMDLLTDAHGQTPIH